MNEVRLLTPGGSGAIAVLRLRGPLALARLAELAAEPLPPPGVVRLVRLRSRDGDLDDAILVRRGAEEVELHLTASPPLVEEVQELLGSTSLAPVPARSLEEQAEELLVHAVCDAGARILLDQAEGALRRELSRLLDLESQAFQSALAQLLEHGRRASHALEPRRLVLAGPANAGKSTLFNVLLGEERVLVAPEAGTTRDAIVEPAVFGEWPVELADTAGSRELARAGESSEVERQGQALAGRLALGSDIVLWLRPRGRSGPPALLSAHPRLVELTTMADLDPALEAGPLSISARAWPEHARESIHALFRSSCALPMRAWEPGTPVPFTAALRNTLVTLADTEDRMRRRVLAALLEHGSIDAAGPSG